MSAGSTAFHLLRFVLTEVQRTKSNTGMGFRLGGGSPRPKGADAYAIRYSLFGIKKSKSRTSGTAGAAVPPKTTDPTNWEVELPW
jgi:hypothetical protein